MGYIKDLPTCKTITNNGKLVYTDDGVHSSTIKVKTLADIIKNSRNTSQSDYVDPSEIGGEDGKYIKSSTDDGSNLEKYRESSDLRADFTFHYINTEDEKSSALYNYGTWIDGDALTEQMGIEFLQNAWNKCNSARYDKYGTLIDIDYSIYIQYLKAIGIMSRNLGSTTAFDGPFADGFGQYGWTGGYSALEREYHIDKDSDVKPTNSWFRLGDCMPWIFEENPGVPRLQYLKDWVVLPYIEYTSVGGETHWDYEVYDEDSPDWDPDHTPKEDWPTKWERVYGVSAQAEFKFRILAPAVYYQFPEFRYFVKSSGDITQYYSDYTSEYKKCNGIAWNRFDGLTPQVMRDKFPYEYQYTGMGHIDIHGKPVYGDYTHFFGDTYGYVTLKGLAQEEYERPTQNDIARYKELCEAGEDKTGWIPVFYDLRSLEAVLELAGQWFSDDSTVTPAGNKFWGGSVYGTGVATFNSNKFPYKELWYSDHNPNPFYDNLIVDNPCIIPNCLITYTVRDVIIGGFGAVTDQLLDFSVLTIGLDRFKIGETVRDNFIFNGKHYEQFLYEYALGLGGAEVVGFEVDGVELARRTEGAHGPLKAKLYLDSTMRYYRITPFDPLPAKQFRIGVKPEVAALYPPVSFVNGGIDSNGILQAEGIIHNVKVNGVDAIDSQTKEVDIDLTNAPSIKYCIFDGSASTQGVATPVLTATTYDEDSNHHFHVFKHYKFNVTRYNLIGSNTTRDMIVDSGNTYFGPCMPGSVGPYFAGAMYSLEHSIAIFRVTIKSPIDATYILFLIPSGETENSYRPFDPNDTSYDPTYTDFDIVEVKAGVPTTLEVIKVMEDGDNTTRTAYIEHSIDPQTWSSGYSSWDPKPCFFRTTMFKHLINL